jgi:hypothetical protein
VTLSNKAYALKMMLYVDYPIPDIPQIVVETSFEDEVFQILAYDERFPNVLFFKQMTKQFDATEAIHQRAVFYIQNKWRKKTARKPLKVSFDLPEIEEEKSSD